MVTFSEDLIRKCFEGLIDFNIRKHGTMIFCVGIEVLFRRVVGKPQLKVAVLQMV